MAKQTTSERCAGSIKSVTRDRGFGFIRPDGEGPEYLFHRSGCLVEFESLTHGMRVTFVPTTGPKGPRAEQIDLVT